MCQHWYVFFVSFRFWSLPLLPLLCFRGMLLQDYRILSFPQILINNFSLNDTGNCNVDSFNLDDVHNCTVFYLLKLDMPFGYENSTYNKYNCIWCTGNHKPSFIPYQFNLMRSRTFSPKSILHTTKTQAQRITLCLRAKSSSWERNVASCSFMTSVLTLATFSPTSRNWSWNSTPLTNLRRGSRKILPKLTSVIDARTRVAAAFCSPAMPGRRLILLGRWTNLEAGKLGCAPQL